MEVHELVPRLDRVDARVTEVLVRMTRLETIVEERTKRQAAVYGMLAGAVPVIIGIGYIILR